MLGRVTVPILPYRRRDGYSQPVQRGAVVTVYNAMPDGTAAVGENGVVQTAAQAALIYRDRFGAAPIQASFVCDEFGGPDDFSQAGLLTTNFSFFSLIGVYHLLVVMPDGTRFGVPFVRISRSAAFYEYKVQVFQIFGAAPTPTMDSGSGMHIDSLMSSAINPGVLPAAGYRIDSPGAPVGSGWMGLGEILPGNGAGIDAYMSNGVEAATGIWGRQHVIDCVVQTHHASNVDANSKCGFGLGLIDAALSASPATAAVWLYQQWNTPQWELLVGKGGSGNTTVTTLTGVPTPTAAKSYACRIYYNPPYWVDAYVEGIRGCHFTDASKFPAKTATGNCGANIFSQEGTNALADLDARFWDLTRTTYK